MRAPSQIDERVAAMAQPALSADQPARIDALLAEPAA